MIRTIKSICQNMAQLYLVCTVSFKIWSAFKLQLPLQFEDSGKSLLSKWSKKSETLPGSGCKILWTDKERVHADGF
jgi:hypothetical protein